MTKYACSQNTHTPFAEKLRDCFEIVTWHCNKTFFQVSIVETKHDKAIKPEKENFGQQKVNFVLILLPACLLSILFTYLSKDILKDCIKKGCQRVFSHDL